MAEKRYYWLKLKTDFFAQKEVKRLRRMQKGDTYTLIYLKMQLKSLESDAELYYEGYEEDFAAELSLDIDEELDNVKATLAYLEKHNLLERVFIDDIEHYIIPTVKDSMGSETAVAARVRRYREKHSLLHSNAEELPGNKCVTPMKHFCNGEIDIELDKDIDKEIDIKKTNIYKEKKPEEGKTLPLSSVKQTTRLYGNLPLADFYEILPNMYNVTFENYPNVPKCRALTKNRKRAIKARLGDELKNLPAFRKYLDFVAESKFLVNECKAMSFDWLLQPRIITNVLEGKYHSGRGYPESNINIDENNQNGHNNDKQT